MENSTSDVRMKKVPLMQCPECLGKYKPCDLCESTGTLWKYVPDPIVQIDPLLKLDTLPPK